MNGKMIAMTVASLLLTAAPQVAHAGAAQQAKVKCEGINSCKGTGACATATNGCAGLNTCKGQGWVEVTAKACKAKKGKILVEKKTS